MLSRSIILWCVTVAVLLSSQQAVCRNVTNEDIRDAILSLVHMFRASEDKLERHEYREKALGELLKKQLVAFDKRQKLIEPVKGMVSRLDERLSNVETILLQKEEREKATEKKTTEALEEIQKSLQSVTLLLTTNKEKSDEKMDKNDNELSISQDTTDSKLDKIKVEIENLKNGLSKDSLRAICLEVALVKNPLEKHLSEAEKLLNKYELKLNEYGNSSKVQTDFVPLSEVAAADEAWHSKMSEVMERQESDIKKIQQYLSEAEGIWKDLPRLSDLHSLTNQTLEAVEAAKSHVVENNEKAIEKVLSKLREINDRFLATNEDIQKSLTQSNTMSETAYADILRTYELVRDEFKARPKNEQLLLKIADNVMATKKQTEYGVAKIEIQLSDRLKALNASLSERFDEIHHAMTENHIGIMNNLTSTINSEMAKVWRQIGIMYQQLRTNKASLDNITEQTEQYVNASSTKIDDIKGKISVITNRMSEVDDNLNYLLGKLSLVTQEFNSIKNGLGEALENVKNGFANLKAKVQDGPGPHNIPRIEDI